MLIGLKLYRSSVPNARADKKLTLMAGFHSFTQSAPSIWAKSTKIDATHRGKPQPQPQPRLRGQTPTLLENRFAFVPEGEELMLKNNASFHPIILHKQCVCSTVLQVSHVTSLAYPCRRSYARNKPQRRFRWRGMSAIKIPWARTRKQQTQPVTARSFNTLST